MSKHKASLQIFRVRQPARVKIVIICASSKRAHATFFNTATARLVGDLSNQECSLEPPNLRRITGKRMIPDSQFEGESRDDCHL